MLMVRNQSKRLCILVSRGLFVALNQEAAKRGVTKSALLAKELGSSRSPTAGKKFVGLKSKQCTLYLHPSHFSRLENLALSLDMSVSALVRAFLSQACGDSAQKVPTLDQGKFELREKYATGQLKAIAEIAARHSDELMPQEKILAVRALTLLGKHSQAEHCLSELRNHNWIGLSELQQAEVELVESRYLRAVDTSANALKAAQKALIIGEKLRHRGVMGEAYLRIGSAELGMDNIEKAKAMFAQSLEMLDTLNYPLTYAMTLIISAHTAIYACEFALADHHLTRLEALLIHIPYNPPLAAHARYIRLLYYYSSQQNLKDLDFHFAVDLRAVRSQDSQIFEIWYKQIYALLFMQSGQGGLAWQLFQESATHEKRIYKYAYQRLDFSSTMSAFIESRDAYTKAAPLLAESATYRRRHNVDAGLYEYIRAAAEYIFAPEARLRELASHTLEQIKRSSTVKQIQLAAAYTLHHKRLGAVI
jgi:hypothetical protein